MTHSSMETSGADGAHVISVVNKPGWGPGKIFTPFRMLILFTCINLVNYLDRGLIPGAPKQVGAFITHDIHVNNTDVDIGLLQSSFIAGYAASSLVFGHLVHHYEPFRLMSVGLFLWCCAIILSGASPHYYVLLIARVCSGVGEASFQCIVPPFLDDHAPPKSRSLWLAIFFSAIPIGYAFGYGFGAAVSTALSWRWAFYIEAMIMAPMAALLPLLPTYTKQGPARRMSIVAEDGDLKAKELLVDEPPSVWDELRALITTPIYMCTVFGYAAYTFVTAGFANFGPIFLLGLNFFTNETTASFLFGGVICITGALGTPVGGILLDKVVSKIKTARLHANPHLNDTEMAQIENDAKLTAGLFQLTIFILVGLGLCIICPFLESKVLFFVCLGFGCLFLFATTAAVNVSIMASVPARSRSFAIGLSTILMHGFGDVPSPTIIGLVADDLAPKCPKGSALTSACEVHRVKGLRITLGLVIIWLVWGVLFWGAGWLLAKRLTAKHAKEDAAYDKTRPLLDSREESISTSAL